MASLKTPAEVERLLRCPRCRAALAVTREQCTCTAAACGARYPVCAGVPRLLDEPTSRPALADALAAPLPPPPPPRAWRRVRTALGRRLPRLLTKHHSARNLAALATRLRAAAPGPPLLLVVGGRTLGPGLAPLAADPTMRLVETDIADGPRTAIVCDAHALPFADASFDAVIAQAVLEHVADPARCVSECRRVLKPGGLIYVETPFLVPEHGAPFDYTRFTLLGLRRLLRDFDELASGPNSGPGAALALVYRGFLMSFSASPSGRRWLLAIAHLTAFWLKYTDHFLLDRPGAAGNAAGYYFLGQNAGHTRTDRELLAHQRSPPPCSE